MRAYMQRRKDRSADARRKEDDCGNRNPESKKVTVIATDVTPNDLVFQKPLDLFSPTPQRAQ